MFATIITLILYVCTIVHTSILLKNGRSLNTFSATAMISLALACHAIQLYPLIFLSTGLNLQIGYAFSLVMLVINTLVLISSLRKPLHNLFILLLPLSVISIIVAESLTNHSNVESIDVGIGSHIMLSIIAYSLISTSVLQALLLHWQNKALKQRQLTHLIKHLPPLQTMEVLMFELLWAGFITLTVALYIGTFYVDDIFAQHLAHKTILSIAAWLIFAILLLGRKLWGWRGNQAIRWVLCGFCCLMLAYFGSKLALEVFLV